MVELQVREDRYLGPQVEQGPIGLVGLADHEVALAVAGVRAEVVELASDEEGRVATRVHKHSTDHGGGGGLAVGATHSYPASPFHHPGQSLRALHHGQFPSAGLLQLPVVLGDSRRDHDHVGVIHVRRIVAQMDGHAGLLQKADVAGGLQVRTGHFEAAVMQHEGYTAHAGAADADEVESSQAGEPQV